MKIAQIMAGAQAGGAELYFERLSIALAQHGETVLPIIRHDSTRVAKLKNHCLTPIELNFGGRFDFLTRLRLNRILEDYQPKLVLAWMNRAAYHTPKGPWILVGRLGGYYDLKYYQHCDYLVANTQAIVDWIIAKGWPAEKVYYLPNFTADYQFTQAAPLKLSEKHKLILSMGRLHPNKAFDTLIRALKFIPDAHLVLAGEGPERQTLEKLIKTENVSERVQLLGWCDDMGPLLTACDVFVCPSRHEPLGNVVIEAFSAQKPVVATRSAGPASLIEHELTGLLAPIDDPITLAKEISRVLNDQHLAAELAKAGRAKFELHFAEKPVIKHWQHVLQTLEKS